MAEFYKVLGETGEAVNGGSGSWHLPKGKRPGKWMPPIEGDLVPCRNGYHLCHKKDLVRWLGPTIWLAEAGGIVVRDDNKVVARLARLIKKFDTWNDRTARLFACDCAEHSLVIYEKCHPDDPRPREAVKVARRFAMGKATKEERAAAWAAAGDAALATVGAAAEAAVGAAARAAEQKWQTKRLFDYLNGRVGAGAADPQLKDG